MIRSHPFRDIHPRIVSPTALVPSPSWDPQRWKVVTRSSGGKLTETLVRVTDPVSWASDKKHGGTRWWFQSNIFGIFTPNYLGKMNPFWRTYVSTGLVKNHQPDEGCVFCVFFPGLTWGAQPCIRILSLFLFQEKCSKMITRWAIYRGYNPSYLIIRPFIGVITPFITGRGPSCRRIWQTKAGRLPEVELGHRVCDMWLFRSLLGWKFVEKRSWVMNVTQWGIWLFSPLTEGCIYIYRQTDPYVNI